MGPEQAEKIINEYVNTGKEGIIAQSVHDLPHSPGMIKYAHYVLAEYLIKNHRYTDEIHNRLRFTYAEIYKFYFEDPEVIIEQHENYLKNLERGVVKDNPLLWILEKALEEEVEFQNFVSDCKGLWNK